MVFFELFQALLRLRVSNGPGRFGGNASQGSFLTCFEVPRFQTDPVNLGAVPPKVLINMVWGARFFFALFWVVSIIVLKFRINLKKDCKNPNNNCTYFIVMHTGHLFKLHTLKPLMCIPSGVMLKPRNIVLLCRKLYFLSLQYNIY